MNNLNKIKFLIIFLITKFHSIQAASKLTSSKYDEIRQLFPKGTQHEAAHWRMAYNDKYLKHPCKRECIANQSITCYYYMVVHYDETMGPNCNLYLQSEYRFKLNGHDYIDNGKIDRLLEGYDDCKYADGLESEVMLVNGHLPGQAIEVCYGDTIVADVINSMHETTTIHWHGIHQRNSPHMDGVPHVTQYPIEAGQAFRYRFEVDHVGTNWWHSHTGHQRAFGLAGPLIVRVPRDQNPHAELYDFDYTEHVIMVQDWVHDFDESVAENILINGRGRNLKLEGQKTEKAKRPTLYAWFPVIRGGRYRFRVIYNGVSNCPISFSIDNHDLIVIASDGNDIEPVTVQRIIFHSAERFDFVLHANQKIDNYWIRVKGYSFCEIKKLHQEAVLHYQNANPQALKTSALSYAYEAQGITLNELGDDTTPNGTRISLADTTALGGHAPLAIQPYRTYYTSMLVERRGEGFRFQMDDISFTMPKISLLQTRNLGIEQLLCNKTQQFEMGFDCKQRHCKCSNVIQVPAFRNVEFVISSKTDTPHPVHLHGYTFRVVGMGVLGEQHIQQIEKIDREMPLPRRTYGAPLKDSVQVPAFGYTIIRFNTDNPGYWIFHCHISPHSENGMAAVLRVGEDVQMKLCPVSNCGLCSSAL